MQCKEPLQEAGKRCWARKKLKRTMSAAARRKIAAFQWARWAKIKQQKKAA
jgi:hypothetical protein